MLPCVPLSNHFFSSPHAAHNPSHTCSVQYHVCLLPPACCCSESLRLRHWRVGVAVGRIRQRQAGAVRCYCFLLWCCKPVQAAGCDEHAHTETQTQGHRQRERDTHTHRDTHAPCSFMSPNCRTARTMAWARFSPYTQSHRSVGFPMAMKPSPGDTSQQPHTKQKRRRTVGGG